MQHLALDIVPVSCFPHSKRKQRPSSYHRYPSARSLFLPSLLFSSKASLYSLDLRIQLEYFLLASNFRFFGGCKFIEGGLDWVFVRDRIVRSSWGVHIAQFTQRWKLSPLHVARTRIWSGRYCWARWTPRCEIVWDRSVIRTLELFGNLWSYNK